jgi:hypothetical protein
MVPQEQENGQRQFTVSDAAHLVFMAAHIWQLPLEFVFRRHFGSRYVGPSLLVAAIWPMFFAGLLFPEVSAEWTIWAFWLILLLGVYHRCVAIWLDRKGVVRHSRWNGTPALRRYFPSISSHAALAAESCFTILLGIPSALISPSLTLFLIGALFARLIKQGLLEFYWQTQMIDLQDAQIEQQSLAERMRNRP